MPPKGTPTTLSPIRLQSISKLKIRHPDKAAASPCLGPMSAMLNCWGSNSQSAGGCAHLETLLRECMDAPRAAKTSKSSINYHLGRLFPLIRGPRKRGGSLG